MSQIFKIPVHVRLSWRLHRTQNRRFLPLRIYGLKKTIDSGNRCHNSRCRKNIRMLSEIYLFILQLVFRIDNFYYIILAYLYKGVVTSRMPTHFFWKKNLEKSFSSINFPLFSYANLFYIWFCLFWKFWYQKFL